jgi:hypothetical protein
MIVEGIFIPTSREVAHGLDSDASKVKGKEQLTEAPAAGDKVKVSPAFVDRLLSRKSGEVLEKHLPQAEPELPEQPLPERPSPRDISDRVLRKIAKRLESAAKQLEKVDKHGVENTEQLERRFAKVVRKLRSALRLAMTESFKALRKMEVAGENGPGFLDDIAGPLFAGVDDLPESVREISTLGEASVSRDRSFSLEVQTVEGDSVTIVVDSRLAASVSAEPGRTEAEILNAQSLSFRVEGQLSDEEMEAIRQLVAKAEELSNSYYGGDLETALSLAQELQLNGGEISSYSLDLGQTVQAQAISAYSAAGPSLGLNLQQLFMSSSMLIEGLIAGALESHPEASPTADGGGGGPALHWSALPALS